MNIHFQWLETSQPDWLPIAALTNEQRTNSVCLTAVTENGHAIEYLTDEQRTPFIQLLAS